MRRTTSVNKGAALVAECLATGRVLLVTSEQALGVLEITTAARKSQATGKRLALTSTFRWPIPSSESENVSGDAGFAV